MKTFDRNILRIYTTLYTLTIYTALYHTYQILYSKWHIHITSNHCIIDKKKIITK